MLKLTYPSMISFAGIDEHTDILELKSLIDYGRQNRLDIEFGVLFGTANGDPEMPRYPSIDFIKGLANQGLNLSLHLCGRMTKEYLNEGTLNEVIALLGQEAFDAFNRIQVNCVGRKSKDVELNTYDKQIIIQTDVNKKYCFERLEKYEGNSNIVFLSDTSGGQGISGEYQCYYRPWQGYAGGININTLKSVIESINVRKQNYDQQYWIDLESGCRKDNLFSSSLCKEIIDKVIELRESNKEIYNPNV